MKRLMTRVSIIAIALTIVLSLVGCSSGSYKKFEYYKTYEGAFYPTFLDTDWGMSKEETLQTLGLSEGDITANNGDIHTVEIKFDGKPLSVDLTFGTEVIDEKSVNLGLTMVEFEIPSSSALNKLEKFENDTLFKNENQDATSVYAICEKLGVGKAFGGLKTDQEYVDFAPVLKGYRLSEMRVNKDESAETLGSVTYVGSALAKIRYLVANK